VDRQISREPFGPSIYLTVWNDAEEQTLDKTTGRFVPKAGLMRLSHQPPAGGQLGSAERVPRTRRTRPLQKGGRLDGQGSLSRTKRRPKPLYAVPDPDAAW